MNFKKAVSEARGKVAILTHRAADIDAVVSAFLLKNSFKNADADILAYEGMNNPSQELCKKYNISYQKIDADFDISHYDCIAIVDTHSLEQIPIVKEREIFMIIDHHQPSATILDAKYTFIDKNAVATAQHILWLRGLKSLNEMEKELCAIAIISDTARFKRFDEKTAGDFYLLLKSQKMGYDGLLKRAYPKKESSETIAMLHGMQRLQYELYKGYIIAYTSVSSNAGELASEISEFADVAFVARRDKESNEIKLSIRCNEFFPFPLNKIAEEIAKKLNGAGGGHEKAAGAFVNADLKNLFSICIEVAKQKIDSK